MAEETAKTSMTATAMSQGEEFSTQMLMKTGGAPQSIGDMIQSFEEQYHDLGLPISVNEKKAPIIAIQRNPIFTP